MVRHAVQISRLRIMISGIALSPARFSRHTKTPSVATPPTSRAMTVAELHGYVLPQYSRASKAVIAEGAKNTKSGRSKLCLMIVNAPFWRPALPGPATALPRMNMVEDPAMPHIKDPTWNKSRKATNIHFQTC